MTISYVGAASTSSGVTAGTAVTLSVPAGTANGDLLVAYVAIADPTSSATGAMNITAGLADWTTGLNNNLTTGARQRLRSLSTVYNSATTTLTATLGGSSVWVANVVAYRDSAGTIGVTMVTAQNSGSSGTTIATLTKSPVTTGVDWASCSFLCNATASRTWTEDIGSERLDASAGAGSVFLSMATADVGPISTGTVVNGTQSGAASTGRTASSLVITGSSPVDTTGSISATLGSVTAQLAGTQTDSAALGVTLGSMSAQLAGAAQNASAVSATLTPMTGQLAGSLANVATLSATLGHVTGQAAGGSTNSGTASATLGSMSTNFNASSSNGATASATLGSMSASLIGTLSNASAMSATLSPMGTQLAGTMSNSSELDVTLGSLSCNATGGTNLVDIFGLMSGTLPSLSASFRGHTVGELEPLEFDPSRVVKVLENRRATVVLSEDRVMRAHETKRDVEVLTQDRTVKVRTQDRTVRS